MNNYQPHSKIIVIEPADLARFTFSHIAANVNELYLHDALGLLENEYTSKEEAAEYRAMMPWFIAELKSRIVE